MAALASVEFYETVTGSCADRGRVEALLAAASDVVRLEAGQTISAATSTDVVLRNFEGMFYFPQRPVRSVASVTVDGDVVDSDSYRWEAGGDGRHARLIALDSNGDDTDWTVQRATVTYDHGWTAIPGDIAMAVAVMAAGVVSGAGGPRVTQHSIEGFSESFDGGPNPDMTLTDSVRATIQRRCGVPRFASVQIGRSA